MRIPRLHTIRGLLIHGVLAAVAALAAAVSSARAQAPLPENLGEFYSYGDNYFLEVVAMPSMTPGHERAIVTFRITYDLLTFRKTSQPYQRAALYIATPTVYAEAIGTDGVIVDRGSWRDTARVEDYARTNAKHEFICGSIELAVRPGLYTIKYSFDDGTPGSGFTQSTPPFAVDDFHSPSPAIGTPIFLRSATADTLTLTAIDGAAAFGRRLRAYIPLACAAAPRGLHYELASVPRKGETPRLLHAGDAVWLAPSAIGNVITRGNDVRMVLDRPAGDSSHSYGALIDCPTDDLNVGDYLLTFTCAAGANAVTDSVRMRIRWVDMPFSLTKAEYAIRALYPIATDEVIDALLSGGRDAQRQALNDFWQKRDPTPTTIFNEAMAEYYQRVDYAFFNFKSIGQNDGAFTDRGKIYLLDGPPGDVSREMLPNAAPREVWTYRNQVQRRFVFVDDGRSGDYRLVEYDDL